MSSNNDIFDYGSYITLGNNSTKMFRIFDKYLLSLFNSFNIYEYQIPAMIDGEILQKCGYFSTFPQHLTVAASLKKEAYNHTACDYNNSENYKISRKFFTPAACIHIYPTLENEEITDNRVYTTLARVYRHENGLFEQYTRLWDFTVREFVFVGDNSFVVNTLEDLSIKILDFAKKIGINAKLSTASDNFYPSSSNIVKQRIQKANLLKKELITEIDGHKVALCSFNVHNYHFSKAFNFDNGGKIETGCIGFGMERWLAAFYYNKVDIDSINNYSEQRNNEVH